jgi:hypothetical protein
MTIRSYVARRVGVLADLISAASFLQTHDVPHVEGDLVMRETFIIGPGAPGERKAAADEVALALGTVAAWRNGYYGATARFGALSVEIVFAPLIAEADTLGDAA